MADPTTSPALTRASVFAAHALIKPYIHHTPVLSNATLTRLASTPQSASALESTAWAGQKPARPTIRLWFKCENLQRVGAFKARGAFHAVLRLKEEEGWSEERGVVTHSSGNHAQALSLAAQTFSIPAFIVMPTISTPSKIAATKSYGARVIFSGSTSVEREAVVEKVVAETGARLVPPYDHPDIVLGQGTVGLEMQAQVERMLGLGKKSAVQSKCSFAGKGGGIEEGDAEKSLSGSIKRKGLNAIITPCGGGGLLSGIALSCEDTGISVFGAEPSFEGADDIRRGLAAGSRIETVKTLTIADGLRTPVGKYPWGIIHDRKLVQAVYSVTEAQIKKAMRLVFERMKVVVEPSAVVGLAVVLFNEEFRAMVEREAGAEGWDLGVVFTGGNVGVEALGVLLAGDAEGDEEAEKEEEQQETQERLEGKVGVDGKRVAENVAG